MKDNLSKSNEESQQLSKAKAPSTEIPYSIFGITFASKQVLVDFMTATFFIVVVPLMLVGISNQYFKNWEGFSELQKVVYAVVPAVVLMNIVIIIYIYKVIKDPENYKKDPPLVIRKKQD